MQKELIDQLPPRESAIPNRPIFLTVLCILSMTGSTFWIGIRAYSIIGILTAEQSPLIPSYYYREVLIQLSVMAACELVVLAGVIMMWKLKRTGYYIYIAGQVTIAAIPWIMNNVLPIDVVLYISGLFIFLYGANYKALRK